MRLQADRQADQEQGCPRRNGPQDRNANLAHAAFVHPRPAGPQPAPPVFSPFPPVSACLSRECFQTGTRRSIGHRDHRRLLRVAVAARQGHDRPLDRPHRLAARGSPRAGPAARSAPAPPSPAARARSAPTSRRGCSRPPAACRRGSRARRQVADDVEPVHQIEQFLLGRRPVADAEADADLRRSRGTATADRSCHA